MEMDQYKEHHLSRACIGSLVKHLTSPTTMNPSKDLNFSDQKGLGPERHKKQVRRRLHTTRPYQERLVNMAEARKEIVTALKYHRASMKQAKQQPHPPSPTQPCFEPETNIKSGRNPRSNSPFPPSPNDLPYPWPAPEIGPPSVPNFTLPNHLLGLNHINPSSVCSSPSSSCSPILSVGAQDSVATISQDHHHPTEADRSGGGLHQAMDDEEMAEIRSIGEQHEMEWNDTMNLVTSAWWFKFFKEKEEEEEEACITDEVMKMQFPSCLNPTETLQDPALPW